MSRTHENEWQFLKELHDREFVDEPEATEIRNRIAIISTAGMRNLAYEILNAKLHPQTAA